MCTVTIVPIGAGARLICNRDERRSRPTAIPPQWRRIAGGTAIWPVDPVGGGTWIAANDAGVAMVLLNRNPQGEVSPLVRSPSRGTIIPALIGHRSGESALDAVGAVGSTPFEPFTLLILHGRHLAVVTNTGTTLTIRSKALSRPVLFTSSSLGDHVVAAPRRALFAAMVATSDRQLQQQLAFHRHHWSDRPEVSVLMSRRDAATVSRTVIDIEASHVRVRYRAIRPGDFR
jgi:hypothetical protein